MCPILYLQAAWGAKVHGSFEGRLSAVRGDRTGEQCPRLKIDTRVSCSSARARASPRSTHANEASPRSLCLSASYFKEFIALDDGIHTTDLHFVRANSSNLERSSSSRQQQRNKAGRDQQFDHASPGERARHAP